MAPLEPPASAPKAQKDLMLKDDGPPSILHRLDLAAILIALAGICLLGVVAAVMMVGQLAGLISSLWSSSVDRWMIVALGVALVWIAVRRKKM
jgi:hypothetical protein